MEANNRSASTLPGAPACALFDFPLLQLQSVLPQLAVLGVALALMHIGCRADRALAAHDHSCLGGCLCRRHYVRVPTPLHSLFISPLNLTYIR